MNQYYKLGLVAAALTLTLAACAKSSTSETSTSTEGTAMPMASASAGAMTGAGGAMTAENGAMASAGAKVYQTNCSSCHQATGEGIPSTFPPLAGNATVGGDATKVIHIVKYGLTGKIVAKGVTYDGQMPAWGTQLSDADIAAAVTYIRSAWGNKAGAVTTAEVKSVAQ